MKTTLLSAFLLTATFALRAQDPNGNYVLLPENLAFFNALRNGSTVQLRWQTVNEQHSKGFTVQRKTSGAWETISFVPTNSGGNSSARVLYDYTERNTFRGVTQYRIAEVTTGGKYRWSEVKAVKGEEQTAEILLYPNPTTNGNVCLLFDDSSPRDVTVFNASGKPVKMLSRLTNNNLPIENLHTGFHVVHITNHTTGKTAIMPFMVAQR